MAEADRAYAVGLAAVRKAAQLTQVEMAQKLGVSQARVSQIEQTQDMLLSTLNSYLEAIGGHATVLVRFEGGKDVELELSSVARSD
jgi:transcriptional regulator with XRE-family HTH domain